MRFEHTVTTLSWIPSYAVTGLNKAFFESGFTHYDEPPPDALYDLDEMKRDDRFRYANRLSGWIEVEDGRITDCGYVGGSVMGATTVRSDRRTWPGSRPSSSRSCAPSRRSRRRRRISCRRSVGMSRCPRPAT